MPGFLTIQLMAIYLSIKKMCLVNKLLNETKDFTVHFSI